MAGNLIRSAILSGAAELIRSHGRQPAGIARRAGVPLEALRDPDLLVPARNVLDFFELAATTCHDRSWGLELGSSARLAAVIGPLWILLRNARTVREMCEELVGNFDLYSSAAMMSFEPARGGGGLLNWTAAVGQAGSEVQMSEFALATFCNEIRSRCPPGWMPSAVLFRHAAPPNLRLHRKLFGADLRFDQDRNALLLDRATLELPLQGRATHARALIRTVLRHEEEAAAGSVQARTESIVRALMPFAACGVGDVALAMGVAPRTLQERLQRQGLRFKQIKDAVRADLALKYLQHSTLSAAQIAEVLGYADQTSFSRSFRRWHGCSARELRRQASSRAPD